MNMDAYLQVPQRVFIQFKTVIVSGKVRARKPINHISCVFDRTTEVSPSIAVTFFVLRQMFNCL